MKSRSIDLALFILGVLLTATIFLTEIIPLLSFIGAAAYILVVIFILWLPGKSSYATALGIITTVAIIAGYLITTEWFDITWEGIDHRLFTIVVVWLAIFFTIRYKYFAESESKQKEKLSALFENATEGLLITNRTGKIVMVNQWAERMFGYNHKELNNAPIEKLIPPRFVEQHAVHLHNFMLEPKTRSLGVDKNLFGLKKDGSEFPIEISLSHFQTKEGLFVIVFIMNATERKKANENIQKLNEELESRVHERTRELSEALCRLEETNQNLQQEIQERQLADEKLMTSQQKYNAIAHNFPNGIIGVLNRDLNYVFVDGKELYEMGLSQTHLIGQKIFDDIYPLVNTHAEPLLQKAFQGETVSFEVALSTRDYNVKAVPLPDRKGFINEILIVINNITELKKMQTDLMQALEKEHELGELKSRFVTMASHEFRTPLSTILSSVFLLENYTGEDYEREKMTHINRIKRAVNNLTEILNDFLSLGKLEEGKVRVTYDEINIREFLGALVKEIEVVKSPDQSITYEHSGDLLVSTDKQLFKNITLNLISNAFKYSPKNGRVLVSSTVTDQSLILKVTDFGIGIPDDDQRHIFKRFFRAKNATNLQGTGLGLNIVKKYATLLRGKVGFKSEVGKGTTFVVTVPVHQFVQNEDNKYDSKPINQQV